MTTAPNPRQRRKVWNQLTLWPIRDLAPYAANARTHGPEQVARLAQAIDRFGLAGVIVVRNGTIAKGHGTLAAVRQLIAAGSDIYPVPGRTAGAQPLPTGFLPVQDASGWDDATFRAFVLADNRLAEQSGWDTSLLHAELAAIAVDLPELVDLTGFDLDHLDADIRAALPPVAPPVATRPAPEPADPPEPEPDPDADADQDGPDTPAGDPGARGMVYQIIVGMDQATKKRYLKLKRSYSSADDLFRDALDHLEASHHGD